MNIRTALGALLISAAIVNAQDAHRRRADQTCPGGKAVATSDEGEGGGSLDLLIRMSDLIVDAGVVQALLPVNREPGHLDAIETDSLVSITQVLYQAQPVGANAIAIAQEGGKMAQCEKVVPNDPLVKVGDRYVLFLHRDNRTQPPNPSGAPRYTVVGTWLGKAKIDNGKVQFLPAATPELHKLDNADAITFIATVQERISVVKPKNERIRPPVGTGK